MDLLASIQTEFPKGAVNLTDKYIEQNPDPTEADPLNNWLVVMPAYMSWCIRSPRRNELLVLDNTIHAIANFGRFKRHEPSHLNFWSLCNPDQRAVVASFLGWCLTGDVLVHEEQVERSLKYWRGAQEIPR